MKIAKSLIAVVGMLFLLVSCEQSGEVKFTSTGAGADLKVMGSSFDLKSNNAKLTFKKVELGLENIIFKHQNNDDAVTNIKYNGHYTIDLLTGTSTPEMVTADLKPGKYVGIEATVNGSSDTPSLICEAELTNNNATKTNIIFNTNNPSALSYTSKVGFSIKYGHVYTFVITFILPTLFDDIELDTLEVVDGTITIDSNNNSEAAKIMESNIEKTLDCSYQINGVDMPF